MWHSSSSKTWQTTFDGREGWQPIFLRRGFPVYIIDLPRQGRASWGCEQVPANELPTIGRDQTSLLGFPVPAFGEVKQLCGAAAIGHGLVVSDFFKRTGLDANQKKK
jgi:hypothetical protein